MAGVTGIRTHIFISDREVFRAPECRLSYERHAHLSRAGILLPDPRGEYFAAFKAGDPVRIRMGYRDEVPDVWTGTVSRLAPPNARDQILVHAVGGELPLNTTKIKQSWMDETPEAIVRFSVKQAGMSLGRIDSPGVVFPRFTASNIPVWQVVRQCENTCVKAHGLAMDGWALWVGLDGKVNWGPGHEEGDIPVIQTGNTLIRHLPAPERQLGLGVVETFLIPGFRRCGQFRLIDTVRGIDAVCSAVGVTHVIKPTSVRTHIRYGDINAKY